MRPPSTSLVLPYIGLHCTMPSVFRQSFSEQLDNYSEDLSKFVKTGQIKLEETQLQSTQLVATMHASHAAQTENLRQQLATSEQEMVALRQHHSAKLLVRLCAVTWSLPLPHGSISRAIP